MVPIRIWKIDGIWSMCTMLSTLASWGCCETPTSQTYPYQGLYYSNKQNENHGSLDTFGSCLNQTAQGHLTHLSIDWLGPTCEQSPGIPDAQSTAITHSFAAHSTAWLTRDLKANTPTSKNRQECGWQNRDLGTQRWKNNKTCSWPFLLWPFRVLKRPLHGLKWHQIHRDEEVTVPHTMHGLCHFSCSSSNYNTLWIIIYLFHTPRVGFTSISSPICTSILKWLTPMVDGFNSRRDVCWDACKILVWFKPTGPHMLVIF